MHSSHADQRLHAADYLGASVACAVTPWSLQRSAMTLWSRDCVASWSTQTRLFHRSTGFCFHSETCQDLLLKKLLSKARELKPSQAVWRALRHLPTEHLLAGLKDASALFRHEVAYCLGQRQDAAAIKTLKEVLADSHEHCM